MISGGFTIPHSVNPDSSYFHIIIGFLLANTLAIFGLIFKVGKNVNKARIFFHRQNWRVNILWQERLEQRGLTEDPIEKELFGEHFIK